MSITRRSLGGAQTLVPAVPSGQYVFPCGAGGVAAATTGNGTLRLTPWLVERAITIDRLGVEVTIVGEAGSVFRLGIYGDSSCYPGALIVDGGTVVGDTLGVKEVTISAITLEPGVCWLGGVAQAAATTQPTIRCLSGYSPSIPMRLGSALPSPGGAIQGYSQNTVTGALPATFSTTVATSSSAPRLIARVA